MSYATMQDVLFDLELDDPELRDRGTRRPDVSVTKAKSPEKLGVATAKPKQVLETRPAA